jgi:hypothetical protein
METVMEEAHADVDASVSGRNHLALPKQPLLKNRCASAGAFRVEPATTARGTALPSPISHIGDSGAEA